MPSTLSILAEMGMHVDSDLDIHEFPYAKELKDSTDCHWFVVHVTPPSWKQHLKEISLEKLYDIHDKAYMRQVVLDNVMNRRTRELMSTLTKAKASCDAIRERERDKDKEYAELEVKCNDALQDLEKNPLILDMRAEIETLQGQVNRLHGEYSRLVLEEKKWVNYQQTLAILCSNVEGLEVERERLKKSETQLLQEVDGLRQDRVAVVAKFVPHVAMELVRSDKMGLLVVRLANTALFHGRCSALEEVAALKEQFELEKMSMASIADPYAPLEVLLSKKPKSLREKPAPSKGLRHAPPLPRKVSNEHLWEVNVNLNVIIQLILFIVDFGCTKHMTGNLKLLCNFVEKYLGIGNDLLTDNRGSDLYTISLQETTSSTLICFMAKASPTQAWLWHRRLSHLNFDYINLLSKKDVVIGLPKLKYVKDQLCSSCEVSKAKRSSFKTKVVPSSKGRLNLLHMDLCGPMRVASINGKKCIPIIVDNYSRYTWTLFLRSKDETPEVLKDFLTVIQRNLQALVISVRTDRGTKFLNKTLHVFFKEEGIEHQTSTPRTPEQNGVFERQNRTLVEAARMMLSASKLPLFFWAEAIATACYTQNRSIIIPLHEKRHITSLMTGNLQLNTFTSLVALVT
ncbi:retrovirus-related pol polyprotein from transposon TNT 1-94 [Tanacetum coccineum]